MLFAADYPFLNILWSMIIFFVWVAWIWTLIIIFSDLFRRHDSRDGQGGLDDLPDLHPVPRRARLPDRQLARHGRAPGLRQARASQAQFDDYVQSVATRGGAADEIDKAKQLLDSGAITQAEFEQLKAKALA